MGDFYWGGEILPYFLCVCHEQILLPITFSFEILIKIVINFHTFQDCFNFFQQTFALGQDY